MRACLPVLLLISAVRIQASSILHTLEAQAYRDEALLYPMVGTVAGQGFAGSGVLISDRWVLTAGHVADFKTGGTFRIGGANYSIESYTTHPNHPAFSTSNDVGLLFLSTAVSGIEAATMIRFDPTNSLLGREATWVGNGVPGTGLSNPSGPNEMRAFTNVIDGLTPRAGLPQPSFFSDFDSPDGSGNSLASDPVPTRLEGNVTPGDSGGGVFIMHEGRAYLAGITSYTSGFSPGLNSKYGSLSGAADLGLLHSWIFETTGIAAVPEPGTLWLGSIAILLGWVRRR